MWTRRCINFIPLQLIRHVLYVSQASSVDMASTCIPTCCNIGSIMAKYVERNITNIDMLCCLSRTCFPCACSTHFAVETGYSHVACGWAADIPSCGQYGGARCNAYAKKTQWTPDSVQTMNQKKWPGMQD